MKLSIIHLPRLSNPWLLKRLHGEYKQHAHFETRRDAEQCRILIDKREYPYNKKYRYAVQRILTVEEFKRLNKKPKYKNVR